MFKIIILKTIWSFLVIKYRIQSTFYCPTIAGGRYLILCVCHLLTYWHTGQSSGSWREHPIALRNGKSFELFKLAIFIMRRDRNVKKSVKTCLFKHSLYEQKRAGKMHEDKRRHVPIFES